MLGVVAVPRLEVEEAGHSQGVLPLKKSLRTVSLNSTWPHWVPSAQLTVPPGSWMPVAPSKTRSM